MSDNYLVELDLSARIDLDDGVNYKMTLIPPDVPKLKDQALWSNSANTTLFNYGGRGANSTSTDNGAWAYSISEASWQVQMSSVKPVRLVDGGTPAYCQFFVSV